jgi:hypothetical protein
MKEKREKSFGKRDKHFFQYFSNDSFGRGGSKKSFS